MRDQVWLENTLDKIWNEHFSDVTRVNPIVIRFGKKSSQRLGSILLIKGDISRITITALFKDDAIPEFVVYETISHELIHYIHGFSSKIKKTFKYPHQGGIIRIEMENRGLGPIYRKTKIWMKRNWVSYVKQNTMPRVRKRRKPIVIRRIIHIPFIR